MRGEFLDLGGVRLYYYASGPRSDSAPPVVLIHGFATSAHLWGEVAPLLARAHRVVVLDLLGHGRSDRAGSRPGTLVAHADRVTALLDALQVPRACVVGHEIGAGVALHLALRTPERVSHLALVCPAVDDAWPSAPLKAVRSLGRLARRLPAGWLRGLIRREWRHGYSRPDRGSRSTDLYLRPFERADGHQAVLTHLAQLDPASCNARPDRLHAITAPTAVIWGEADRSVRPAAAAELAARIPAATSHPLTDVRHFAPEEVPEQVATILEDLLRR